MDTCYIPNNPNFGPDLWRPPSPETSPLRTISISPSQEGNTLVPLTSVTPVQDQTQPSCGVPPQNSSELPKDIITNLTISTLDLEPLPGFFTFSPDQINYRDNVTYQPQIEIQSQQRPPEKDQVSDVLASLKNIIHSGPMSPSLCGGQSHYGSLQNPNSVTYSLHSQAQYGQQYHQYQSKLPHLLSSSSLCPSQYTDAYTGGIGGPALPAASMHGSLPSIFPSMNVNVSMNMTMGVPAMGYGFDSAAIQPQVQWNALPQTFAPQTSYNHPLLSPIQVTYNPCPTQTTYNASANYSFSADFKASSEQSFEWKEQKSSSNFKSKICSESRKCSRKSPILDEDLPGIDKPNLCRVCGKTYARPSTLKTHLRTHSGEKPYKCLDCNKSFSQAANLTAHVRTHSGEKPFKCGICDRRFSQSSSVTTHMRTHSGDRPYRCRMCRKAFSDSSTLTKHMRIHSGEKPYQCKLCMLRFSQSGNLNRHMRVHSGAI